MKVKLISPSDLSLLAQQTILPCSEVSRQTLLLRRRFGDFPCTRQYRPQDDGFVSQLAHTGHVYFSPLAKSIRSWMLYFSQKQTEKNQRRAIVTQTNAIAS